MLDKQVHQLHAFFVPQFRRFRRARLHRGALQPSHGVPSKEPLPPENITLVGVDLAHERLDLEIVDFAARPDDIVGPGGEEASVEVEEHGDGALADVEERQRGEEVVPDEDAEEDVVVDDALQIVGNLHLGGDGPHFEVQIIAERLDGDDLQRTVVELVVFGAGAQLLARQLHAFARSTVEARIRGYEWSGAPQIAQRVMKSCSTRM